MIKYKGWKKLEPELRSYMIYQQLDLLSGEFELGAKEVKEVKNDVGCGFCLMAGMFFGMAILAIVCILLQSWSGIPPLCPL